MLPTNPWLDQLNAGSPRPSQPVPASGHMAHTACSMPNPILALASGVKPLMLPAVHGCSLHTNPFRKTLGQDSWDGVRWHPWGVSGAVVPSCAKCFNL